MMRSPRYRALLGIIVGREVSRLARNNTDWYQVLDLCSITDTLIADSDGIYHPGDFNPNFRDLG